MRIGSTSSGPIGTAGTPAGGVLTVQSPNNLNTQTSFELTGPLYAQPTQSGILLASPDAHNLQFMRANVDLTLLASAARTVTTDTADQTNYNGRGAHVVVDVTAASGTAPTLTITIQGKDSVSGQYYTVLQSVAITAIGTYVFRVYPGETVAANLAASDILPRTWRVDCAIGGTTPSFTFSVGASNIL